MGASVWSFGTQWGANSFASKVSSGLRMAPVLAAKEGWYAARASIFSVSPPGDLSQKRYFAGLMPRGAGRASLCMMVPTMPGWSVRCVSQDGAFFHVDESGRLVAVNPDRGFWDMAPGANFVTARTAMLTLKSNAIFTNVAITADNDVWWEGLTPTPPANLTDWQGQRFTPAPGHTAAHPNSRYCVSATQSPVLDLSWDDPHGVPISAFIVGRRRAHTSPLICEATSWESGMWNAATSGVEDAAGIVQWEPFGVSHIMPAMSMGRWMDSWVKLRLRVGYNVPRVFVVNFFRQDGRKRLLWPGYDENSRLVRYMYQRLAGEKHEATKTPLGRIPAIGQLDLRGVDVEPAAVAQALIIDAAAWQLEVDVLSHYLGTYGDDLPEVFLKEFAALKKGLAEAPVEHH